MRVKLFQEAKLYPNGMYLEPGSIGFDASQVFVLYQNPSYEDVIGYVSELKREEDNWITGETSIDVDTEWFDFSMYCDKVEVWDKENDPNLVTSARLRAISLQPIPADMNP